MSDSADVAAFQVESVHEDVAAAFFEAFAAHGLTTYAQFNRRILDQRGDFFEVVRPALTEIDYIGLESRADWKPMNDRARRRRPRFLFFNSFQRDAVANMARDLDLPAWGVVHNPALFAGSEGCLALAREHRIEAFTLAPHVARVLESTVPELAGHIHVHHPVGWAAGGPAPWTLPEAGAPIDILIPGALDYKGRAWEALLDYLDTTDLSDVRPFRIHVVSGGPDRADFEAQVAARGLTRLFCIAPLDPVTRRVPHSVLMARMFRSHLLMPMLPPNRLDFVKTKISTSLSMIQGAARPAILPRILAETYGCPALISPDDRPYDLRHLDLSNASLVRLRCAMLELYARLVRENVETLSPLIGESPPG